MYMSICNSLQLSIWNSLQHVHIHEWVCSNKLHSVCGNELQCVESAHGYVCVAVRFIYLVAVSCINSCICADVILWCIQRVAVSCSGLLWVAVSCSELRIHLYLYMHENSHVYVPTCMCPLRKEPWKLITTVRISDVACWSQSTRKSMIGTKTPLQKSGGRSYLNPDLLLPLHTYIRVHTYKHTHILTYI